eukprot:1356014-Amphidinium_carterae.1
MCTGGGSRRRRSIRDSLGSKSLGRKVAQTLWFDKHVLGVEVHRPAPTAEEVELRVRAVGLNFRDVLNVRSGKSCSQRVMGLYPGDPGNPGGDCAGTVCNTGADVTDLRPGDDVFGIAWGCLQTYVKTNAYLMAKKPSMWDFEQMAAWSVTFATVEEAFQDCHPVL